MSQSSVKEQVTDLASAGFPVRQGTRSVSREGKISAEQFGSDLWFSRWANNAIRNFPIASQCYGIRFLHDACHGMPAFVVGVGPSLDESIVDLKRARGRALILSTDAALRALLANDITPDIVLSYDCKSDQKRLWQDIPPNVKIPALFSSCAHPDTLASWPGPILLYNQYHTQDDLCKRILPDVLPELGQLPSTGTVGNMATLAAHAMGCDPICCVGMDFCYQPAKSDGIVVYLYRAQDYKWTPDRGVGIPAGWEKTVIKELYDNDERLERTLKVKGDDGQEYMTDPELCFYFDSFIEVMPHFKVPVVNCAPKGRLPKLKPDHQGRPMPGGFPSMTVGEAIDQYCKSVEFQGGRTILPHLAAIAPDPRKPLTEFGRSMKVDL